MSSISTLSGDGVVILLITTDGDDVELSGFTLMMVGTEVALTVGTGDSAGDTVEFELEGGIVVLLGVIVGVEVMLLANGAVVVFDAKLGDEVTLLVVLLSDGAAVVFPSDIIDGARDDCTGAGDGNKVTLVVVLLSDGAAVVFPSDIIDGARDDRIGAGDGTSDLVTPVSKSSLVHVRSAKVIAPAAPSSR